MGSSSVNKHIVVGNVGQPPQQSSTPAGTNVVNFSVATSSTWKDKESGESKERTEWHNIVAYGRLAEVCAEYAQKGRKVYVEGESRTSSWEKDGVTHRRTSLYADDVQFLDSRAAAS